MSEIKKKRRDLNFVGVLVTEETDYNQCPFLLSFPFNKDALIPFTNRENLFFPL